MPAEVVAKKQEEMEAYMVEYERKESFLSRAKPRVGIVLRFPKGTSEDEVREKAIESVPTDKYEFKAISEKIVVLKK
jgi:hypothetical protein